MSTERRWPGLTPEQVDESFETALSDSSDGRERLGPEGNSEVLLDKGRVFSLFDGEDLSEEQAAG